MFSGSPVPVPSFRKHDDPSANAAAADAQSAGTAPQSDLSRRQSPRFQFPHHIVVIQFSGADAESRCACPARDLSSGGIGLLSNHPIPVNNPCQVQLQTRSHVQVTVSGRIVWCRSKDPVMGLYELGIAFDQPMDVTQFLLGHPV